MAFDVLYQRFHNLIIIVSDGQIQRLDAHALGQIEPRNDIGMMLQLAQQYDIAPSQVAPCERRSYSVQAIGRSARKDDLFGGRGTYPLGYRLAGLFVDGGRYMAKGVVGAMDIGIVTKIILLYRIDDIGWLERSGRIVEVDKWAVVYPPAQLWKMAPPTLYALV